MTRRSYSPPVQPDIFGPLVAMTMLMSSTTAPLAQTERDRLQRRLDLAFGDLNTAKGCSVASWRDATDAMNFLQSAAEQGFIRDEGNLIADVKAALLEGTEAYARTGDVRLSARSLNSIGDMLINLLELLAEMPARDYWKLVASTKQRMARLYRGQKKAGDKVVSL